MNMGIWEYGIYSCESKSIVMIVVYTLYSRHQQSCDKFDHAVLFVNFPTSYVPMFNKQNPSSQLKRKCQYNRKDPFLRILNVPHNPFIQFSDTK